jgi:hypothetical protein
MAVNYSGQLKLSNQTVWNKCHNKKRGAILKNYDLKINQQKLYELIFCKDFYLVI